MKYYMDCKVCYEIINGRKYWVIRDYEWKNRLVAKFTDA